jgi:hypothetical protein
LEALAAFVKESGESLRQRLALWPYSSAAGPVERGGVAAVRAADAVSLSYLNYDLACEK